MLKAKNELCFIFLMYCCHYCILSLFHFQNNVNTKIPPNVFTVPRVIHHDPCKIHPQSPEEALEEHHLLNSIAWPATPPIPTSLSLKKISDPSHSTFTILPKREGGHWNIGDELEIMIKMHDVQGNPKTFGGDVLLVRLHNPTLDAGVAGKVVDHLNGSYSAVFSLLWEGEAQVEVMVKPIMLSTFKVLYIVR